MPVRGRAPVKERRTSHLAWRPCTPSCRALTAAPTTKPTFLIISSGASAKQTAFLMARRLPTDLGA
jgi:hypothetical protein